MTVGAKFCPRCSASLTHTPPVVCEACGYAMWVNPRPTGTVIIVQSGQYLALKRARPPREGWWDLPGGFCDGRELPADAALREAHEELGIAVRLETFVGMYIGEYLYQDELLPVLDCFWLASIVDGDIRPDPEEATEFVWLPLADPPPMAFATMDVALGEAMSCLERSPTGM